MRGGGGRQMLGFSLVQYCGDRRSFVSEFGRHLENMFPFSTPLRQLNRRHLTDVSRTSPIQLIVAYPVFIPLERAEKEISIFQDGGQDEI